MNRKIFGIRAEREVRRWIYDPTLFKAFDVFFRTCFFSLTDGCLWKHRLAYPARINGSIGKSKDISSEIPRRSNVVKIKHEEEEEKEEVFRISREIYKRGA